MMMQARDHFVTAKDMVRSHAWRAGYESFRRGEPPEYQGRGSKSLAYEYGRLTAAYLQGQGQQLIRVSTTRPIIEHYVPEFADALLRCVDLEANASPKL